jgi:hypothetical protein
MVSASNSMIDEIPQPAVDAAQRQIGRNVVAAIRDICATHLAAVQRDGMPRRGIFYPAEYWKFCAKFDEARSRELRNANAFWSNHFPTEYWEAPAVGSDDEMLNVWSVKRGVSASEAVDAAIRGPSIAGCLSSCLLSMSAGMRDFLGQARFDQLFGADGPLPLRTTYAQLPVWLSRLPIEGTNRAAGSWYAFEGIGSVLCNLIGGIQFSGQSLNAICTASGDAPTFAGLNGQFVEGSEDDIFSLLYEAPDRHTDIPAMWKPEQWRTEREVNEQKGSSPLFQHPSDPTPINGFTFRDAVNAKLGNSYQDARLGFAQLEERWPGLHQGVLQTPPFQVQPVELRVNARLLCALRLASEDHLPKIITDLTS